MPRKNKLVRAPEKLKQELERLLIANHFTNFTWLTEECNRLAEKHGWEERVSINTVWRYGKEMEERLVAIEQVTRQAQAVVTASPDNEGAVNDALMRLVQERLFTYLVEAKEAFNSGDLADIAKAIGNIARASVNQKEWEAKYRKMHLGKLAKVEEQAGEVTGERGAALKEAIAMVRREVYGLEA